MRDGAIPLVIDGFYSFISLIGAFSLALCNLFIPLHVTDVFDDVEYLSSLGKAQTANVKRDAAVGVAQANRDAGIRVNYQYNCHNVTCITLIRYCSIVR